MWPCPAQRAFDLLASCDYIAKPSVSTVQALLILGHVLQNQGRPQAAWILSGSTIRMAAALGILPGGLNIQPGAGGARISPDITRSVRLAIVWQDALLSLAFGSSSLGHEVDTSADLPPLQVLGEDAAEPLTYSQAMHWLCFITVRHRVSSWCQTGTPYRDRTEAFLGSVRGLESSLLPQLRDAAHCHSIQAMQEHYSLELHLNSVVSTFCRPVLSRALGSAFQDDSNTRDLLLSNLRTALKRSVRAFIRLLSISSQAARSWAFVHNGLTSALLLSFMKETRTESESLQIQTEVIQSLVRARDKAATTTAAGQMDSTGGHLTEMHEKCLASLQSLRRLAEEEARRTQSDHMEVQVQAGQSSLVPTTTTTTVTPMPGHEDFSFDAT